MLKVKKFHYLYFFHSDIPAPGCDDVLTCDQCGVCPRGDTEQGLHQGQQMLYSGDLLGWKPKHSDNLIETK